MFKKLKEKKGFTLVELIVVLVILAILAALLIPALTGYIDRAKRKSIVAETRQAVMAAQTIAEEDYAKNDSTNEAATENFDATKIAEVEKLAEVSGVKSVEVKGGKVTQLVYNDGKKTCTYYKEIPANTTTSDGNYDVK